MIRVDTNETDYRRVLASIITRALPKYDAAQLDAWSTKALEEYVIAITDAKSKEGSCA